MDFKKIRIFFLYLLIFLRPFISSQAFPKIEKFFLIFLVLLTLSFFKEISYKKYPLLLKISFLFYLGGGLISSSQINTFLHFPIYFMGILFFLITLSLNQEEIKKIIAIIILSGTVVSLYGIYQYQFGFLQTADYIIKKEPYLFANHLIRNYLLSRRVFSTFFSPNMLAGYLVMVIPLNIGYISEIKGIKKITFCLFAGINFLALFLTKSLGGIFSLIFSFFILLFFVKPKKISLMYLSFSLVILILFTLPIIISRANRIFDFQNPHNSLVQRYNFMRVSLKIIKENLCKGIGMGNFGDFFMHYRKESDIRTNYAHNFILQIQAELGILGSLGIFLLIILFLKDMFSLKGTSFLRFSLLWASSSFLIHNFLDISFFIPEVANFFWIIWPCFKNLSE